MCVISLLGLLGLHTFIYKKRLKNQNQDLCKNKILFYYFIIFIFKLQVQKTVVRKSNSSPLYIKIIINLQIIY
jgi:hypothetical protein